MSNFIVTRRAALIGLSAFAAAGLAGCNSQAPVAASPAAAPTGYRIANVAVDVGPLTATSGNPTAQWVQDAMPAAVAQAFRSHMAPGDASGGTLGVVVNTVYLGNGGPADADRMSGVATWNGQQIPVKATATWFPNPTDQALWEQSNQNRVNALAVAFAYQLKKKIGK